MHKLQNYMILSFLNSHSKMKFFEEHIKDIATLNKKNTKNDRLVIFSYNGQIETYWIIADMAIFHHNTSCQIAS